MKSSDIFRKAAVHSLKYECYCCIAIMQVGNYDYSIVNPLLETFAKYFKPDSVSPNSSWFGYWGYENNQKERALALLLMPEICKSEGD